MLRATQILPHTRYSDTEARTYVSLSAHARHVMSFKLTPAATLEITLSQFWSSLGEGNLDVEVAFHGVAVTQGSGVIAGPSRSAKVQLRYVRYRWQCSLSKTSMSILLPPSSMLSFYACTDAATSFQRDI